MVTGLLFGLVNAGLGWTVAFVGAFGAIAVFILAAATLAVMDERQHRA